MGTGYLKVEAAAAFDALPVAGLSVVVKDDYEKILYELITDESGETEVVDLTAPDSTHTLDPDDPGPYYATYTVEVAGPGYETVIVHGVQIFDGQTALLPVEMLPQSRGSGVREYVIPENTLQQDVAPVQQGVQMLVNLRRSLVIPETVTVHLGSPASSARNVRIGFVDYIKNVASSEIYPTWPQAALEANIYCQISFALNRVYTEWYPSRGYGFHITSSTAYDQSFVEGRNIFANISQLVDEIFNIFIRRQGHAEPFFASYCNGTTVTCAGLSQWGTVPLAQQGQNSYQILRHYYPSDIQLVEWNLVGAAVESYPGAPLREGSSGDAVRRMQAYLNRIRVNYPAIPLISPVDGAFGTGTTASVRTFQRVFDLTADGIVGKATWYKIISIYNAVKKLADMESEGERIGIGASPPTSVLREGSRGADVVQLQFILAFLAQFYSDLPEVLETSQFDAQTKQAVIAFQRRFGLTADGIVGSATWQKLYEVYRSAEGQVPPPEPGPEPGPEPELPAYPGELLRMGSRGEPVRTIQRYLNAIYAHCPGYTALGEDGIFGEQTLAAVRAFQGQAGLSQDGIVGPLTWDSIVGSYNQLSQ